MPAANDSAPGPDAMAVPSPPPRRRRRVPATPAGADAPTTGTGSGPVRRVVMRVTLIRHAEAGDDAPRDEARALTVRGREDARRLGRALARRGVDSP